MSDRKLLDRVKATLLLDEGVSSIKGVSAARSKELASHSIHTVRDLVTHFPFRYVDMSRVSTIASAPIGEISTIACTVHEKKMKRIRRNLNILEITFVDDTGTLIASVFNKPWMDKKVHEGQRWSISGKVTFDYGFKRMASPIMEELEGDSAKGTIMPIHSASSKLTPNIIRMLERRALDGLAGVTDPISAEIRKSFSLMSRNDALRSIHFPTSLKEATEAKRRLAFEEILLFELYVLSNNAKQDLSKTPIEHVTDGNEIRLLEESLPFSLTEDQQKAKDEMLHLMGMPHPMNMMIIGDVGTGKTAVAAFGVAAAKDSGYQSMLLVPTEVLAEQHESTFKGLFSNGSVSVTALTGSTSDQDRTQILRDLANGDIDLLIGTHALLEDDVIAKNAGFLAIDEQHRFGVEQRQAFLDKSKSADVLYLTATPIPRSLAHVLFGNLQVSFIKQKPYDLSNRQTRVLSREDQGIAFDAAREAVARGEQVFVVCPLIEPKSKAEVTDDTAFAIEETEYVPDVVFEEDRDMESHIPANAKDQAERLRSTVFAGSHVGLLYGSMPSDEKRSVMRDFANGVLDVLVSTTVIEVGIDVKNATTMIVLDADRFGLAQLHQLRGRVGRGEKDSQVFLISSNKRREAIDRLKALESSDDGFELAEFDLSLRREGDILGNRQSGTSSLKLVNVMRDSKMIEVARQLASQIVEEDPLMEEPDHRLLAREMRIVFGSEDGKRSDRQKA